MLKGTDKSAYLKVHFVIFQPKHKVIILLQKIGLSRSGPISVFIRVGVVFLVNTVILLFILLYVSLNSSEL